MGILRKIKIHHMLYDIAGIYLALFLAYFFRFGQFTLERIDSEFFYAAHLMAGVFLIFFVWIWRPVGFIARAGGSWVFLVQALAPMVARCGSALMHPAVMLLAGYP